VLANQRNLIETWPGLKAIAYPDGTPPAAGSLLRQSRLATSLESIAQEGRDAFYSGAIAEAISRTIANLGGWMTSNDLASHQGEWVDPIHAGYRDATVATMPPNAQGITALIGLRMADHEDIPAATWGSGQHIHPLVEAARRAYTVRDAEVTDPRFRSIDTAALLADDAIDALWQDYRPDQASAQNASAHGDTVYLCAVDADGNAVSMIQSLFGAFGSCVVAEGTGILLQNRGSSFSLDPDHANVLQGGKRTMHTLMPSMLFRGDELVGPFGTQGGDAQARITMQLASNLVDFGMEPQMAIEAPRWLAGSDGSLIMEQGFPDGTVQSLASRGHRITLIDSLNSGAGHAQMVLRNLETGLLMGAADPRADGSAAGY
jgi:gamma-glutamyltranspeptidase/glutathione hydrolase